MVSLHDKYDKLTMKNFFKIIQLLLIRCFLVCEGNLNSILETFMGHLVPYSSQQYLKSHCIPLNK